MNTVTKNQEHENEMRRIHEYGKTIARLMNEAHKGENEVSYASAVMVDAAVVMSSLATVNFSENGEGFTCDAETYDLLNAINPIVSDIHEIFSIAIDRGEDEEPVELSEGDARRAGELFDMFFDVINDLLERTRTWEADSEESC